jgi:dienelactone hydrolase
LKSQEWFDLYERRFSSSLANLPNRRPWLEKERVSILRDVRTCLGIRNEWLPKISANFVRSKDHASLRIEHLSYTSWPNVYGSALLYIPETKKKKLPFVLLCCGHDDRGKYNPGYQTMARHIARQGIIVLCSDNIGQGERKRMGHSDCWVPFACGTSLQGFIVLESMAWLDWAASQTIIDSKRMATVGNSGGGTLSMFIGSLCPDLAAVSSSGYPSSFEFIARKEKKHCACNIIPGVIGLLEMWHLFGCVAPRPLCIFQGESDPLFPPDIFYSTARKIHNVYSQLKADSKFHAEVTPGAHSWDRTREKLLGKFLVHALHLKKGVDTDKYIKESLLNEADRIFTKWPKNAINAAELARGLTGNKASTHLKLWDIFPPCKNIEDVDQITPRADTRQILAQFEAFFKK